MVRKECRHCGGVLPHQRFKRINGHWIEQYFRLHPNFCNCQGNVFIHRECIRKEALDSPDRCPHCRTPWNNLIILRKTIDSFEDLKKKYGFWATIGPIVFSSITTPFAIERLFDPQSRKKDISHFIQAMVIWIVIYWVIRLLAYKLANALDVRVAYSADVREVDLEDICRYCFAPINELQDIHKIKVYPKRYFCGCNEYTCGPCMKNVANVYNTCNTCNLHFRKLLIQDAVPISYVQFRRNQHAYTVYKTLITLYIYILFIPSLLFLVFYVVIIPYLQGEVVTDRDRQSTRFKLIRFLVDYWWTVLSIFLAIIVLISVFFIEIVIYPGFYIHLRSNNQIETRRVVTIEEVSDSN